MSLRVKEFFSRSPVWPILLLILLPALAYAPSLRNNFVWDDFSLIVDNTFVHSWKNLPLLLKREYLTAPAQLPLLRYAPGGSGEMTYRPVSTLTLFIDYALWQLNPFGYHLTNLLLHIANGLLLYVFILRTAGKKSLALLAALLFTLHPANTEPVAVISFREDLLALFFGLITLLIHTIIASYHGWRAALLYTASLVSYLLALFSKEMAITLPILIVLYDRCLHSADKIRVPGQWMRQTRYFGGYLLLSLLALWVWFGPLAGNPNPREPFSGVSILSKTMTIIKVIAIDLGWLLFPANLHATVVDQAIIVRSAADPKFLCALSALILTAMLTLRAAKKSALACFSSGWFFLTLLPVLHIIPIANILAERFLYIPSVGFCLFLSWGWHALQGTALPGLPPASLTRIRQLTALCIVGLYLFLTFIQIPVWKNNLAFQTDLLTYYPQNAQARFMRAETLQEYGLFNEAAVEYRKVLQIDPAFFAALDKLGLIYLRQGQISEASRYFKQAQQLAPDYIFTQINQCRVLAAQGQKEEADACLDTIRRSYPALFESSQ